MQIDVNVIQPYNELPIHLNIAHNIRYNDRKAHLQAVLLPSYRGWKLSERDNKT